ncbi:MULTISPECIES: excinuclease ABC subunit C [unclassified Neptuniibacter]|uniref:excinuclease ABC subunit C n=1 Tax=unclassified Neptuniibacter TaxID=2630693 RepID=UPI000C3C7D5D|nr:MULTISPECIES: excinuclease ABC subunit C [unclassified Neptuniibacter]MAY43526.1 excinuclease ABC subunit C [Oceanospirillaceae bacterium]|tara:strand:- start:1547 stop:1852 length:306 start_codon:yes stop_codon:yes gene_type:complete
MTRTDNNNRPLSEQNREVMLSESDINTILVNGAQISLTKLRRAKSTDAQLCYYAEIGVYLEVSLSRGAGITEGTLEALEEIHRVATHEYMETRKLETVADK